ncbi:hypothetical protein M0E87_04650 [Corynebacterium sp. CCM 9185]|uniref:YncE family protein n=1 Tax=Corynebacterium marambiense TaxID=2765364 RepID=A0ABS0VVK5_9CORY|nr:hypothetical protein [Corynebacterium marambiense]MBI9000780.1 hypothetical protein [Corynebacterium marambiense]MCK7662954.1 hypothetical protein [Corynebacterium marambiense]
MSLSTHRLIGRRSIAAITTAALLSAGMAVVTPNALAQEAESTPTSEAVNESRAAAEENPAPANLETTAEAAVSVSRTFITARNGIVASVFEVKATGFAPGATLTAGIDDTEAGFHAGGSTVVSTATADENGEYKGRVVGPADTFFGGTEHTVTLTAGETKAAASAYLEPAVSFGSTDAPDVENLSVGATDLAVTVRTLKPGSTITAIGVDGANWLPAGTTFTVPESGTITVPDLSIPADDSLIGKKIAVTVRVAGSDADVTLAKTGTIAPGLGLFGSDQYNVSSRELGPGLYQMAYSAKQHAVFVTRNNFGDQTSSIFKVNPETLEPEKEFATVDAQGMSSPAAGVFGVAVDDVRDRLWVTNTLNDSVSVYSTVTGELLKAFDKGLAPHPRAVAVDESTGYAYVSIPTSGKEEIVVFGGDSLDVRSPLQTPGFSGHMELRFDAATKSIYTVSFKTGKAAKISVETGQADIVNLPNADAYRGGGVGLDTRRGHLFVASQIPSSVDVFDINTGALLKTIRTGAGSLDALYDAVTDRVYVINRGSRSATVINAKTFEVVANLDVGFNPNHLATDGKGTVYVVNKPAIGNAADKDSIVKLTPKNLIHIPPMSGGETSSGKSDGSTIFSGSTSTGSTFTGIFSFLGVMVTIFGSLFHFLTSTVLPPQIAKLIPGGSSAR